MHLHQSPIAARGAQDLIAAITYLPNQPPKVPAADSRPSSAAQVQGGGVVENLEQCGGLIQALLILIRKD